MMIRASTRPRRAQPAKAARTSVSGVPAVVQGQSESPLLLSGVARASANQRSTAGLDQEERILTAEEIAALDLTGIERAVLFACGGGVGRVAASEGVFGLRRAFRSAVARPVVMGLWLAQDEAARDWMLELDRQRLRDHKSAVEASRAAGLKLPRRQRARGRGTHPSPWGAFSAAGKWQ